MCGACNYLSVHHSIAQRRNITGNLPAGLWLSLVFVLSGWGDVMNVFLQALAFDSMRKNNRDHDGCWKIQAWLSVFVWCMMIYILANVGLLAHFALSGRP